MDRVTVAYGQIPLETDLLRTGRFAMVGLAKLAEAVLGAGTWVDGFSLAATATPSMSLTLGAGQVYEMENLEASAWSSLGTDNHSILKQGLVLDAQALTFVAPTTVGFAQYALIQVQYLDTDTGSVVRPYFNAANPAVPYSGPGNAGTADNTIRSGAVSVSVKYGTAATSGTQVAPTPDAGFAGLWLVTLAYGQTSITSANWTQYPGAPFISVKLPNFTSSVTTIVQSFVIKTAVSYTVYGAGANFTDLNAAFAFLSNYTITSTGSVTLNLAAGQWIHSGTNLNLTHPNGNRITITGAALSGSVPSNSSFTLTGNNSGTRASNGTANLTYLRTVFATELRFTSCASNIGLFGLSGSMGLVQNVLLTSDGSGSGTDIVRCASGVTSFTTCAFFGAVGRGFANTNALTNLNNVFILNNGQSGLTSSGGGQIQSTGGQICCFSNGGDGMQMASSSALIIISSTGIFASYNAGNGFNADGNVDMYLASVGVASFNGGNGYLSQENAVIHASTTSANNNSGAGYSANACGYMIVTGASASGNTGGSTSPAVNTVGNANSYIVQ